MHPRTVSEWMLEGLPVARRGAPGLPALFDLGACCEWVASRQADQQAKGHDLEEARARKEHWQALLAEQAHHARERELLPAVEVARVGAAERARVRRIVGRLPSCAPAIAAAVEGGPAGVEVALRKVVNGLLRELAGAR